MNNNRQEIDRIIRAEISDMDSLLRCLNDNEKSNQVCIIEFYCKIDRSKLILRLNADKQVADYDIEK
jgi:hypothetical protein